MRSIVFAGHDLSRVCSAEVVARSACPAVAEAMRVPGRAGALLLSGWVPPAEVRVRLMLDAGMRPGPELAARVRSTLRRWLCRPEGGELVLPDDPSLTYRDALLTYADGWSDLFGAGECELTFTLFDPIGYGAERTERTASFWVGGTWDTLPRVSVVAREGGSLAVALPAEGRGVRVELPFAGGEEVVVDCERELVSVGGSDARAAVTLGSDFFSLSPGDARLSLEGCSLSEVRFCERWA